MVSNFMCLHNPGKTTPWDLEVGLQNPSTFKWYVIPLFIILFYVVWRNLKAKRYSVILGGLAFWLWDLFNETWNSMVYATTGQPVWGTTLAGGSAFQILIGYNIEISIMFMFLGMATCYMLKTSPGYEGKAFFDANKNFAKDPNNLYYCYNIRGNSLSYEQRKAKRKILLNRVLVIVLGSISAVIIEIILNKLGVLTWEKPWWQPEFPWLIFLIGYAPFFICAVVIHDAPRKWQIRGLAIEAAIVVTLLIISGSLGMLGHQIAGTKDNWVWVGKWLRPGTILIR